MTTQKAHPNIILIPGHWLGAWAWDEVLVHLLPLLGNEERAVPLTLPGLDASDPDRSSRTLDDQAAAIEQALTSDASPAVIVAHSGANAPVSLVLDRHPDLVRRVIWVDSGPVAPGTAFAPGLPEGSEGMPLPPFEVLGEQASLAGLEADALERFRTRAVAQPGPVLREPVTLSNDARHRVPTTLVCCSIPSTQVIELVQASHPMFAEVANLDTVEFVDLPTGHWPMWSRPAELAQIIATASAR